MAALLQAVLPPVSGFCVGWATRRRLAEAARTCLKREGSVETAEFRFEQRGEQQEPRHIAGRWCDCSSMVVVHRMYLSSSSFSDLAVAVRKLATSRTATPGFKGICVFRRPLEQQPAAAAAEAAAGGAAKGAAAQHSDSAGAEFLLVEEWLNPLAAGEALNPRRASRGDHNQMKANQGSAACQKPVTLIQLGG
ncbi:hypothetical protein Esti_005162 [Eimeria stiedai]